MTEYHRSGRDNAGDHVFVVSALQLPGDDRHIDGVGEVRWSPQNGLTFSFNCPDSHVGSLGLSNAREAGKIGVVTDLPRSPELLAHTIDGLVVTLYALSLNESFSMPWAGASISARRSVHITGAAYFATVIIPRSVTLSFWDDTEPASRLLIPGLSIRYMSTKHVEITTDTCVTHRMRGELALGGPGSRCLVSGWNDSLGIPATWVTYDAEKAGDPFWYPEHCSALRGVLSILLGRHVSFAWRDSIVAEGKYERLYYGRRDLVNGVSGNLQFVPLSETISSITYGSDVVKRLDGILEAYSKVSKDIDVEWIVSPLWAASRDYADNKLSYACVAIERLATACGALREGSGYDKDNSVTFSKEQKNHVRRRFREVLDELRREKSMAESAIAIQVLEKRIDSLFQPPNSDRLFAVFARLGIELRDDEKDVIKDRNKHLHGRKTLESEGDSHACDMEIRRFDVLRTLIARAVLHMLGYDGPYIDYADRPESGGFAIRQCAPPKEPVV